MKHTTQHTPATGDLEDNQHEANAALIAAAPELLAACNQVRGDLGSGLQAAFGDDVTIDKRTARTLVRVLDAAINKTKGE